MISSSNLFAAFACALTAASASTLNTRQTKDNAIYTPGLNELVPVGAPYKITWKPDVPGLVNIYLLRGPTENLKVLLTIVEGIDNKGSYVWTPPTTLEDDPTHYGLNLTMPGVPGEFQYSTQFGISNKGGSGSPSSSSSSSASGSTTASGSGSISTTIVATTDVVVTKTPSSSPAPTSVVATGAPFTNGTVTTGKSSSAAATPSASAKTNGTTSAGGAKPSSGAVSHLGGGFGAVIIAFGAALMI